MVYKLGNNWARGENYEVKGKNKDTFIYINDHGGLVTIDWEAGWEPYNRMIYSSSLKEWDEPKGLPITQEEKEEIKKNSKEAWEFLGVPIVFDD